MMLMLLLMLLTEQIEALTGEKYTFAQMRDAIWRAASGLKRHGIRKNDMVMLLSENSVEYVIACHAILSIGATVTMANPQSTASTWTIKVDLYIEIFKFSVGRYVISSLSEHCTI